jgi:DNA-binding transcriptional regulator YiaG
MMGVAYAIDMLYHGHMDISSVQARREALGLSRRQFADLLGVDHVSVWRWETKGKTPILLVQRAIEATLSRLESEHAEGLAS